VRDESSEKLINKYVKRRFQSYLNNNVKNVDLWKSIYYDFEYFTLRVWKMISSDNWVFIKRICLTQEFWLNQVDQKSSRSKIMYKVSKKNYYADWTLIQIEKVEKTYEKVFRDMQIRKKQITIILNLIIIVIIIISSISIIILINWNSSKRRSIRNTHSLRIKCAYSSKSLRRYSKQSILFWRTIRRSQSSIQHWITIQF
jgi:hypothetical protein